jgi:hypothetical protein
LDAAQACANLQAFASKAKAAERQQLLQTLAVLVVLHLSYTGLKDQWKRAEKKARSYVELKAGVKFSTVMDLVVA